MTAQLDRWRVTITACPLCRGIGTERRRLVFTNHRRLVRDCSACGGRGVEVTKQKVA